MAYNERHECSQRAIRRNKRGRPEKKDRSTPAQRGSASKHTTAKDRLRVPPRKDYPTKPKDPNKRDKLEASRYRTSEFAHPCACDSDLTHEWNRQLQSNQGPDQDQDTHYYFVTIDNVKKPYYGVISVCDGFEDIYCTSIRYNYDRDVNLVVDGHY